MDEISFGTSLLFASIKHWNKCKHFSLSIVILSDNVSFIISFPIWALYKNWRNTSEFIPLIPMYIIHIKLYMLLQKVFFINCNCCFGRMVSDTWWAAKNSCMVKWRKLNETAAPAPLLGKCCTTWSRPKPLNAPGISFSISGHTALTSE